MRFAFLFLCAVALQAQQVRLSVTVFDEKTGDPIPNLTASNFRVTDGADVLSVQKVGYFEDEKLDVMLIFDSSILADRIKPVVKPMIEGLGESDQMALVSYDQSATLLEDFTGSVDALLDAYATTRYGNNPRGLDALFAVLDEGFESTVARRVAILLSSGAEANSRTSPGDVLGLARRRGIAVHTVYWENTDASLFDRIAEQSGGAHFAGKKLKLPPKDLAGRVWKAVRSRYVIEATGVYRLGNRVQVEIVGGPKGKIIASALPLD